MSLCVYCFVCKKDCDHKVCPNKCEVCNGWHTSEDHKCLFCGSKFHVHEDCKEKCKCGGFHREEDCAYDNKPKIDLPEGSSVANLLLMDDNRIDDEMIILQYKFKDRPDLALRILTDQKLENLDACDGCLIHDLICKYDDVLVNYGMFKHIINIKNIGDYLDLKLSVKLLEYLYTKILKPTDIIHDIQFVGRIRLQFVE